MVVVRLNLSVSYQFMQADLQENQNSSIPLSESRASGLVSAHQALWTTAVVWERHDISGRGQILQVVLLSSWLDNPVLYCQMHVEVAISHGNDPALLMVVAAVH